MQTVQLYIGSNNTTHKLEIEKIKQIMADNHEGFTIQRVTGYWLGKPEKTALVTVSDDRDKINTTVKQLKSELQQDAIALLQTNDMVFA